MTDGTTTGPPEPLVVKDLVVDPPLLNASGALDLHAADPDWRTEAAALAPLGAYVTKTLTLAARPGNPRPWVELVDDDTLYNSVGLANPGLEPAIGAWGDDLVALNMPIVVSIGGGEQELGPMAAALSTVGWVAALEVNLSCPNVAHLPGTGGMAAANPEQAARSIGAVRASTPLPILAKLSPAADVAVVATAVVAAGADAVVAVNSMPARLVDEHGDPVLGTADCGMSGGSLHPIALRCVADAAGCGVPVIGLGGVSSIAGARRMRRAGAAAVAVGSAAAMHPTVLADLAAWMTPR